MPERGRVEEKRPLAMGDHAANEAALGCDNERAVTRQECAAAWSALDDRLRHLERIAALRHPELYENPEATARQLTGQRGSGIDPLPPDHPAVVDPW
jgi:hypothetical protein